ncbi:helix-turn-helix domain-containing protein [Streptomyces bacillaris]|uniref:helix-turn-helix domain-containing protein n=1 Tax=Streptomyces bacillaris TaxID=68179 RepID=UPI003467975B
MGNEIPAPASATRFGELLQELRRRSSFTQSELSGFSTVSVRAIRNLELGQAKNPRRETVRLLADALRLGGEQRAALQLAAGLGAYDVAFDDLPALPHLAARPLRGRDTEAARLLRLYRTEHERLAAITGLGGVGKSRLALTVAHALQAEEGIATLWWSLPGPARRGKKDRCGPPTAGMDGLLATRGGSVGEAVRLIGDRSVLLVLDGNDSEQITADTIDMLLDGCPNLLILQTSRMMPDARWRGFRLSLSPLTVPVLNGIENLQRVAAAPAVAVLLDRVADMESGFRIDQSNAAGILEICARLDGLPRALESVASWLVVSSASELVHLARAEPHVLAEAIDGCRSDADWVAQALEDALEGLTPQQITVLVELSGWETPWTMQQLSHRIGMGRIQAAAAVHAYLQCGLVRRMPSAQHVVFGVVHVMRAPLRSRVEDHEPGYRPSERYEDDGHEAGNNGRTARGLDSASGFLRRRPGRDDAA